MAQTSTAFPCRGARTSAKRKNACTYPFELLSDSDFEFTEALDLPTFQADGHTYIKRTTLIVKDACVEKVFYPVFPPNENAAEVTAWLQKRQEELS